jgi:Bacterial protein of unknown function (DUF899)
MLRVREANMCPECTRSFVAFVNGGSRRGNENMSRQAATLEKANALSDQQITSREEWLIARQDLLKRETELARLRHQLSAERRALAWAKVEKKDNVDVPEDTVTLAELSDGRNTAFIKQSRYRLMGLVGVTLIAAVYLLLQLQKLPNSSLSYSLLYAVISLLFNFSSSALLKVF